MVKWKLTPQQKAARKKKEAAALAAREAAKSHLAKVGQCVEDERDARVGTGAASRSRLSKTQVRRRFRRVIVVVIAAVTSPTMVSVE